MKFRNLKKKFATFGIVSALSVLCLGYQNCSRAMFSVDDAAKAKVLADTPVFGDEHDPGVDPSGGPVRDPGVDPVTGLPRDPATDPVGGTPRDPATDPVGGTPRDPATDPVGSTPRDPATDPVGSTPRDPATDPSAPKPRKTPTPAKKVVSFEFACPMGIADHGGYKPFASAGEVKAVIVSKTNSNDPGTVCEIADVRSQVMAKSLDISKCFNSGTFVENYVYIVEKAVTSNYEKFDYTLNAGNFPYDSGPIQIGYAEMEDKANAAGCDVVGDPLVVQLANNGKPQPISLTSADQGVMFDLLGKKNNYQKVQTAWFSDNKSENYFLVLPDAKGSVKGIDQMFGDNTVGPDASKPFAAQGFDALAKHDENGDLVINSDDSVFSSLRLWKDDNLDGIAQASELYTLGEKGVVAIDIKIDRKERRYLRTDSHGNMTKYRSIVIMKDGQYGLIYDLWLRYNQK